jgi:hypothetical protein
MKKNSTLLELLIGIILSSVVIQIIVAIILKDYLYNAIGLWSGTAIACFMAIHMKRSIEDVLDLGEEGGVKRMRSTYLVRMMIVAIAMGIVICFNLGNPITMLFGALTLKIAAYLQPYINKLFQRFSKQ